MTTEDDFQKQLDAHPDDHQTRLVFADWLEEHGDPRAEGYRALDVLRVQPCPWVYPNDGPGRTRWLYHNGEGTHDDRPIGPIGVLPDDWRKAVSPGPLYLLTDSDLGGAHDRPVTRRQAEDAVALAFAKLPKKRRAKLLNATPPASPNPPA